MRAFVEPFGTFSPAMVRIANALKRHAPGVEFVDDHREADLTVLYVIGWDQAQWVQDNLDLSAQRYAVVQCCLRTAGQPDLQEWLPFWRGATGVWSYLARVSELADQGGGVESLYGPLGIDEEFFSAPLHHRQRSGVVTTGHLSDPRGEAIEEVWAAALRCELEVYHLGTKSVTGVDASLYPNVNLLGRLSEQGMVDVMSRAQWSASLRHVEGFELPAAEGLACGLRPILFAQGDLQRWYGPHAVYVSESSGEQLVDRLAGVLQSSPRPVTEEERAQVRQKLSWKEVTEVFWAMTLRKMRALA